MTMIALMAAGWFLLCGVCTGGVAAAFKSEGWAQGSVVLFGLAIVAVVLSGLGFGVG